MKRLLAAFVFVFCGVSAAQAADMKISSTAFAPQSNIPKEYTCDGGNASPVLSWQDVPAGTKSLALIMDDPDAPKGTWTHWVMYNIPAASRGLPASVPIDAHLPDGTAQGQNSFPAAGYGGPCPPPGKGPHRYYFKLYALDRVLDLDAVKTDSGVLQAAIKGHVIGNTELMGRYERR